VAVALGVKAVSHDRSQLLVVDAIDLAAFEKE